MKGVLHINQIFNMVQNLLLLFGLDLEEARNTCNNLTNTYIDWDKSMLQLWQIYVTNCNKSCANLNLVCNNIIDKMSESALSRQYGPIEIYKTLLTKGLIFLFQFCSPNIIETNAL